MPTSAQLKTVALVLLITGAIDSIRNLPAAALFGQTLIFFFVFGALFFLIPTALVSAELAANIDQGGIYHWCRIAFGESIGFLAVWLQWVNNLVWFPTILSFVVGTASYLINPLFAQNKWYLIGAILGTFWLLTLINLRGIRLSARFTSFCALVGLIIPVVLIISLLLIWLIGGYPRQIHFSLAGLIPHWSHLHDWLALTAIMLGFAGMELATVHINEVHQAAVTFPRALAYSTVIILVTMMLGSLAIAIVLPYDQINLVNGTITTFAYFLSAYHLTWLTPLLIGLLVMGSAGGIISWIVSPLKGLRQAAEQHFLPRYFMQENAYHAPARLLIAQGVLVSVVSSAFLLLPSINGAYWLLTALTTQLYMLMYLLMFLAALRIRHTSSQRTISVRSRPSQQGTSTFTMSNTWLRIVCILGLIGCIITLLVGFLPPAHLNVGTTLQYESIFISGMMVMLFPVLLCDGYRRRKLSANSASKRAALAIASNVAGK